MFIKNPVTRIGDKDYMTNAEGAFVPVEAVKPQYLLEDQMVRKIFTFVRPLSEQIARFKAHTFDDITTLQAILEEEYGLKRKGGKKGNVTYQTYDGLMKVEVRIADKFEFGPELQTAKGLIDECIMGWAEGSNAPLRALVTQAFQVDDAGKINRNDVLKLRTLEIGADEPHADTWARAMDAITDSIRVIGTKAYLRFWVREEVGAPWLAITVDLASAEQPSKGEEE